EDGWRTRAVARAGTWPPVSGDQLPPPSTVLNTPSREADTYTVPGADRSVAIAKGGPKTPRGVVGCHVAPPSVLRWTPLRAVAAYTVPGVASTANAWTVVFARPVLALLQLAAPSVLRHKPSSKVPAKTVAGVARSSPIAAPTPTLT